MWHESPGSSVVPWQSWVALNGAATAPPKPDMVTGAVPMLVMVVVWVGALVLAAISPKSRAVPVMRRLGATAVPLRAMAKGWPFQLPELVALNLQCLVDSKS